MPCYDYDLDEYLANQSRIRAMLVKAGYWPTYFPSGEFWIGFDKETHVPKTKECVSLAQVARELNLSI